MTTSFHPGQHVKLHKGRLTHAVVPTACTIGPRLTTACGLGLHDNDRLVQTAITCPRCLTRLPYTKDPS